MARMFKTPNAPSVARQQRGLSLVELMVALVIASLLMLGIGQIYLSSSQTYRVQENLSRMQETGRFASYELKRDVRMAGFGIPDDFNADALCVIATALHTGSGDPPFDVDDIIQANDPVTIRSHAGSGEMWRDEIHVRFEDDDTAGTSARAVHVDGQGNTFISDEAIDNPDSLDGQILAFVGPSYTIIGEVTNVQPIGGDRINLGFSGNANSLGQPVGTCGQGGMRPELNSTFSQFGGTGVRYYIADTGRVDATGNAVQALMRQQGNDNAEEIAEGVIGMQVQYLRREGDAYEVVDSGETVDFSPAGDEPIAAVRIHLLVVSADGRLLDDPSTAWPIPFQTAPDGSAIPRSGEDQQRMTHVYSTTISLRNRTF
ncbi:PilW family protein [Alkalispirillum mobile]|nr:PilW family protein [Alkalispirillum mobile]